MGEGKIGGEGALRLTGSLASFAKYDLNNDGALNQKEAAGLTDATLAEILNLAPARDEQAESEGETNNHHGFFNALPAGKIASLYISEHLKAPCYLRGLALADEAKFAESAGIVMDIADDAGFMAVDTFLLESRLGIDRWGALFGALEKRHPQYVRERSEFDYAPLKRILPDKYSGFDFLPWDTNRDGRLQACEARFQLERDDSSAAFMAFLSAMLTEGTNRTGQVVSGHYVMSRMLPEVSETIMLAGLVVSSANPDEELSSKTAKMAGLSLLVGSPLVNECLMKAVRRMGPDDFVGIVEFLMGRLNDEARSEFQGTDVAKLWLITRLATESPSQGKMERDEPVRDGPYSIDGIESVDASSFDEFLGIGRQFQPVVVLFGASYCPACTSEEMKASFKAISEKYGKQAKFATVDSSSAEKLIERYGFSGIPALLIYDKGKVVFMTMGFDAEELDSAIKAVLATLKKA